MKQLILKIIDKNFFLSQLFFNYNLFKYLKHQKWILKIFQINVINLHFKKSQILKLDIKLCGKIKKEYLEDISNKENSLISNLWKDDLVQFTKKKISHFFLYETPNFLSNQLNTIFRSKYVFGLSSGMAFKYQNSFFSRKIWTLKYLDLIISLCEYYSILRHESPAQGKTGANLKQNLKILINKIEKKSKLNLDFPNIGSPYGININNKLITFENLEHLYGVERSWSNINLFQGNNKNKINVIEIGGGYGGFARLFNLKNSKKIKSYTLVDLPLMLAFQKYFLFKCLKKNKIKKIKFLTPEKFLKNSPKYRYDVLINQNSFAEMNKKIVNKYLTFFEKNHNKNALLISLNHEAVSKYKGKLQVSLPEVTSKRKKFQKLSRNLSWVRGGYVEEVYRLS